MNAIEVRADGVLMRSASCPKQECIQQGEVTLSNHTTRPLGNWIICPAQQGFGGARREGRTVNKRIVRPLSRAWLAAEGES